MDKNIANETGKWCCGPRLHVHLRYRVPQTNLKMISVTSEAPAVSSLHRYPGVPRSNS